MADFTKTDSEHTESLELTTASSRMAWKRTDSSNSGFSTFSSLHESHSRYMEMYSPESEDGVLRLGNFVPNFDAETTQGPMNFYEWKKEKWAILFSHPADFTPVCTSELAALASNHGELKGMNVKVAALSVDGVESHKEWIEDVIAHCPEDITFDFPIISDHDRYIATVYGMLDQWMDPFRKPDKKMSITIRSVFFINPENKLMLNMSYPVCVGRNMVEIVRCMKALQLSSNKAIATPVNWPNNHASVTLEDGTTTSDYKGSVFMLPAVTTAEANAHYPGYHVCAVPSGKSYLRLVKAQDVGTVPICTEAKLRKKQDREGRLKRMLSMKKKRGLISWISKRFSVTSNKPKSSWC